MFDVDLIVIVRNQLHFTKGCVESVIKNVPAKFHLIIVDNDSNDGTGEYLAEAKKRIPSGNKLTVFKSDKNLGYAEGLNKGLEFSDAPYVLFCNNDIEFYPDSIEEMIRIANQSADYGLVNPNSNEFGLPGFNDSQLHSLKGKIVGRCQTSGFCVLVKREVIQKIGGIDPAFGPAYFEDMDFAERAKKIGFRCVVARGAYVHHYGTRTFLPAEKQSLWDRNKELFAKKWGGTKWFGFVANSKLNPAEIDSSRKSLLEIAYFTTGIIYMFLSKDVAKHFENLHDSFRIIKVPAGFEIPFVIGKSARGSKKPISKIYALGSAVSVLTAFKWLHHAEVIDLASLKTSR